MSKQFAGIITLVLAVTIVSCDNESSIDPQVEAFTTSEDITLSEYWMEDTEDLVDTQLETRSPEDDCPVLTWAAPQGEFPNTLTIDFGDGCTGPKGHTRKGQIVVEQSAPMSEANATRVITFVDFFVDDVQILGSKTFVNLGKDSTENISCSRDVEIEMLFPSGNSVSWTTSHLKTQVSGAETTGRLDDVFEITGSSSGVNRNGTAFSSIITESLVKKNACRWITDGTREVTVGDNTRTVDYGFQNGGCDNLAFVLLANGETKVIKIHKRWW